MILLHSATLFHALKGLGGSYLVWLGLQSLFKAARPSAAGPGSVDDGTARHPHRRPFLEGLMSNLLNPKVAIFYLAFLPQFIGPTDPVIEKSLLLATIHVAMGILWLGTLSAIFDRTRRLLVEGSARRWLDGVCGAALVGLGARLALEQR